MCNVQSQCRYFCQLRKIIQKGFIMKVIIINRTVYNQFVDLDGVEDTKDIVNVGPKEKITVDIPNEKRFLEISKKFNNILVVRKV